MTGLLEVVGDILVHLPHSARPTHHMGHTLFYSGFETCFGFGWHPRHGSVRAGHKTHLKSRFWRHFENPKSLMRDVTMLQCVLHWPCVRCPARWVHGTAYNVPKRVPALLSRMPCSPALTIHIPPSVWNILRCLQGRRRLRWRHLFKSKT